MASVEADDELLRRFATAGDRAAMDALVRRHVAFVYAAARREVRDEHLAEDVTQAVFRLLTRRARSVPLGRLGGWLFRATRYAAANARKMEARRTHHERIAAVRAAPAGAAEPHDSSSEYESPWLPLLNDALASLGPRDREAVILRYLRGQGIDAVRAALGVSEAAARKRLTRAVERLRRYFTSRGVPVVAGADAGALGAWLAAATASQAAPAHVTAGVLTAVGGQASAVAHLLAQGTAVMMVTSKAKAIALIVVAVLISTAPAAVTVRYARSPGSDLASAAQPDQSQAPPTAASPSGETRASRSASIPPAPPDGRGQPPPAATVEPNVQATLVVGQALLAYAQKHGRYPQSLDEVVTAGLLDGAAAGTAGSPRYVYNKPTRHLGNATEFLMIHEARSGWSGPVAVAYGDGHVEVINDRQRFDGWVKLTRKAQGRPR